MVVRDAGLASEHWKKYYTPEEVEEIIGSTTTTMIVSGNYPIHVRLYVHPHRAPTVVMAHGMLVYGLILARLQLPFYRAGFNVVQFDLPGLGQSGGPRAGCTTEEIFATWRAAIDFSHERFGDPLFAMGVAEDGVTCYYTSANDTQIQALSVHTLFEYGDPAGVHWQGPPWLVGLKAAGLAFGTRVRPTATIKGTEGIPWEDVFGASDDGPMIKVLEEDPLSLQKVEFRMSHSLIRRQAAPVPFEDCRTPVQVIASEQNRIWPFELVVRNFKRLGGPKEFITLAGKPQWEFNREFHETYCAHVIRWFKANGAVTAARFEEQAGPAGEHPMVEGRLSENYRQRGA